MRILRTSLLFTVAFLPLFQLSAGRYAITTNREGVTGTVNTMDKEQMLDMIGDFPAFFTTVGQEDTSATSVGIWGILGQIIAGMLDASGDNINVGATHTNVSTQIKEKVNPFLDAQQDVMAALVTIKNDSSQPIFIPQNEYLKGIEDYAIGKKELVSRLYPEFELIQFWDWVGNTFGAGLFGLTAIALGSLVIYVYKNPDAPGDAGETLRLEIFLGTGSGLCALATAIFGYFANKARKYYSQAKTNEKNILASTYCLKQYSAQKVNLKAEDGLYMIRPGEQFHDLIFLDLKKCKRREFRDNPPELDLEAS